MNKYPNRRTFLNTSLKAGALMTMPYNGISAIMDEETEFLYPEFNKNMVIRRTPLTSGEYLAYAKQFNNWGRWGTDDPFGTLNFINDDKRKEAFKSVKKGISISCGRALNTITSDDNVFPSTYKLEMRKPRPWTEGTITVAVDFVSYGLHGFVETHIDALNHVHTNNGRMYNNRPVSDIQTTGALSDSIDYWKDGIISRGVYFDIPRLRGTRCITPDKPVQGYELEDYALKYKITPQTGDIIIIDCGREKYWADYPDASRKQGEKPGLDPSVLEFFFKYNSAVLGCDFDESKFNSVYNTNVPLHAIANPYMGLPTLWNMDLNRLRETCSGFNRNDFLFIINPLIIPGGTASIVNPVAVF